jgi:hypothetical protein
MPFIYADTPHIRKHGPSGYRTYQSYKDLRNSGSWRFIAENLTTKKCGRSTCTYLAFRKTRRICPFIRGRTIRNRTESRRAIIRNVKQELCQRFMESYDGCDKDEPPGELRRFRRRAS